MSDSADPINPDHYKLPNGTECIDIIEALDLPHHLAAAFAYIWRAGRKGNRLEDLKKARWYLDRYIEGQEQPPHTRTKPQSKRGSIVQPYTYRDLMVPMKGVGPEDPRK